MLNCDHACPIGSTPDSYVSRLWGYELRGLINQMIANGRDTIPAPTITKIATYPQSSSISPPNPRGGMRIPPAASHTDAPFLDRTSSEETRGRQDGVCSSVPDRGRPGQVCRLSGAVGKWCSVKKPVPAMGQITDVILVLFAHGCQDSYTGATACRVSGDTVASSCTSTAAILRGSCRTSSC